MKVLKYCLNVRLGLGQFVECPSSLRFLFEISYYFKIVYYRPPLSLFQVDFNDCTFSAELNAIFSPLKWKKLFEDNIYYQ